MVEFIIFYHRNLFKSFPPTRYSRIRRAERAICIQIVDIVLIDPKEKQ